MSLDPSHLQYPQRRYGMDHDRYAWSMLTDRPPVTWPGGNTLALWVNVSVQHFVLNPLGQPVKLPGAMSMPYPDLRHFSLRDYGNRVGIYRFLDCFDRLSLRPSFAVNACLVRQHSALVQELVRRGDELLGHSWSMDTPHAAGLAEAAERELIQRSIDTLQQASGRTVRGWLGPGRLQSANTPELLHEAGIQYFSDWVNDELPYRFHTQRGDLWSLPLCNELDDRFVVMDNQHSEASWAQQVMDACDLLLAESREQGGRLLSLSLHPWVLGQPHRIKHLEAALSYVMAQPGVWCAPAGEILDAFLAQPAAS